jgi:hypothetical protein
MDLVWWSFLREAHGCGEYAATQLHCANHAVGELITITDSFDMVEYRIGTCPRADKVAMHAMRTEG